MGSNTKIIPAPYKGINLSVPEQILSPELLFAKDVVNMLPTERSTLRKRPGYRYLDRTPEGAIPLGLFDFGAITEKGRTPVLIWVGHQKLYMLSQAVLPPRMLSGSPGNQQVLLSWLEGEDIDSYEIQHKRPADLNWTDVAVVITDTSYTVTGLTNNQERQFRIRACLLYTSPSPRDS